jgi:hypothetical protein
MMVFLGKKGNSGAGWPDKFVRLPTYFLILFDHPNRQQFAATTRATRTAACVGLIKCAMGGTHQIQAA